MKKRVFISNAPDKMLSMIIRTASDATEGLKKELVEGCRIYYTGDMANNEGRGTIAKRYQDKWGDFVNIEMDDGRKINSLAVCMFSPEYLGHGGTRFVTEKAYKAWRQKFIDEAIKRNDPFAKVYEKTEEL